MDRVAQTCRWEARSGSKTNYGVASKTSEWLSSSARLSARPSAAAYWLWLRKPILEGEEAT
jgi:hypothetical protein